MTLTRTAGSLRRDDRLEVAGKNTRDLGMVCIVSGSAKGVHTPRWCVVVDSWRNFFSVEDDGYIYRLNIR